MPIVENSKKILQPTPSTTKKNSISTDFVKPQKKVFRCGRLFLKYKCLMHLLLHNHLFGHQSPVILLDRVEIYTGSQLRNINHHLFRSLGHGH